jgi:hypothetical protein
LTHDWSRTMLAEIERGYGVDDAMPGIERISS